MAMLLLLLLLTSYIVSNNFVTLLHLHSNILVTKDQPDGSVPALTALPRTEWAKIRKEYFSESLNQQTLEAIEEAMFLVRQCMMVHCKLLYSHFGGWWHLGTESLPVLC